MIRLLAIAIAVLAVGCVDQPELERRHDLELGAPATARGMLGHAAFAAASAVDHASVAELEPATPCAYTEANDLGNDYEDDPMNREDSGLGVGVICGNVDATHFNDYVIDIDDYVVHVTDPVELVITFAGRTKDIPTIPGMVGVFWWSVTDQSLVAGDWFNGNVGSWATSAVPGDYELSVEAYADVGISTSIPYRLTVDAPEIP